VCVVILVRFLCVFVIILQEKVVVLFVGVDCSTCYGNNNNVSIVNVIVYSLCLILLQQCVSTGRFSSISFVFAW